MVKERDFRADYSIVLDTWSVVYVKEWSEVVCRNQSDRHTFNECIF